jgi:hypothetical protein
LQKLAGGHPHFSNVRVKRFQGFASSTKSRIFFDSKDILRKVNKLLRIHNYLYLMCRPINQYFMVFADSLGKEERRRFAMFAFEIVHLYIQPEQRD